MPHLIVEYSANLEPDLDMAHVISVLHEAALETGVFPIGGLRVRASRRDIYKIADGHPDNAFIHVQARIGVHVSWTDGQGTRESLASVEVGPVLNVNDAPTGSVTSSTPPTSPHGILGRRMSRPVMW